MAQLFKEALTAYFKAKHEREDLELEIEYEPGYAYSSVTYENAAFNVTIKAGDKTWIERYQDEDAATFLNDLLNWEDGR